MRKYIQWVLIGSFMLLSGMSWAAGTLKVIGSVAQPIQIQDHTVKVTINNGFSQTEVSQTFFNPNSVQLEGVYVCPVPRSASLSEYEVVLDEIVLQGEVLSKKEADELYGKAQDEGEEAGLASKEAFDTFRFAVSPIPAQSSVVVRYVYYQPIEIDTGVGRYVYPLAEGGTDAASASFWTRNDKVEQSFKFLLELKSGWPVDEVRLPGLETVATIDQLHDGHYQVALDLAGASLNRDVVFYYRLQQNLPGRVELLTYKPEAESSGTFMLVLTPGIDLKPLTSGADYVFVLDISGSMRGKFPALVEGVSRALSELSGQDRFAIVTFNDRAKNLTSGWLAATPQAVQAGLSMVESLKADGGTNLHAGLRQGLAELDDDRATTVLLITDAATNQGEINPVAFYKLMRHHDVRFFGFLLGNHGNWALMETLCEASGGTFKQISNSDDLMGQIMLAKSKVTSEAIHDAMLDISGIATKDIIGQSQAKIFRGEQWVIFGRYSSAGKAKLELKARITGVDKTYTAEVNFPAVATDHPELERLWAMAAIEEATVMTYCGFLEEDKAQRLIEKLGVAYQLVTDETSMVVLRDETFAKYGVKRQNRDRIGTERHAQQLRAASAPANRRADTSKPMFGDSAPSLGGGSGGGGGAIAPWWGICLLIMAFAMWRGRPQ